MYKLGRIEGDTDISSIEAELEIDIDQTMYDKNGEDLRNAKKEDIK
jgi:hypothetical protein